MTDVHTRNLSSTRPNTEVAGASLTIEALERAVAERSVDTVVLALVDMEGRLVGKRLTGRHFLESTVSHGAESCEYLLATDVDMSPQQGYGLAGWNRGFGDFQLTPDLATLRLVPWHPGSALVLADAFAEGGEPIQVSPRQVLRRQVERLSAQGLSAQVGTELEFMIFAGSYREAWDSGYRNLTKATPYSVDYALLDTTGIEPLIRRIRNSMEDAGMNVESSKGECNLGQHEINFKYGDAMNVCDDHVVYKYGAREIAAQEGMAITFMAKFDQREGSSCHVHLSLTAEGSNVFRARQGIVPALPRRAAGLPSRHDAAVRSAGQLLQAVRAGHVRSHRSRVGKRQPNVRDARDRPWRGPPHREPPTGRRRQPAPSGRRYDRRRSAWR